MARCAPRAPVVRSSAPARVHREADPARDTGGGSLRVSGASSCHPRIECPPMPLTPGTRLGPYEITAQIGVGGMGEVYRATDTDLKRPVAIKVLPESVATDPDRLARFRREAEVLAALNHPNIAHIYGVEKSGNATALVMELVDGVTLDEYIASVVDHAPSAHRHADGAVSSSKGGSEARRAAGVGPRGKVKK